jgi:hypothetical protein
MTGFGIGYFENLGFATVIFVIVKLFEIFKGKAILVTGREGP